MRLILTALLFVYSAFSTTRITGTFVDATGNPIKRGSITIVTPRMTTVSGHTITPHLIQMDVRNGVFSKPLYLEPNDTATPANTVYIIQFGFGFPNYTERWSIPTAAVVGIECGSYTFDSAGNLVRTLGVCVSTAIQWSTLTPTQWANLTSDQWATLQP